MKLPDAAYSVSLYPIGNQWEVSYYPRKNSSGNKDPIIIRLPLWLSNKITYSICQAYEEGESANQAAVKKILGIR